MDATKILSVFCIMASAAILSVAGGSENDLNIEALNAINELRKEVQSLRQEVMQQNNKKPVSTTTCKGESGFCEEDIVHIEYTVVNTITEEQFDKTITVSGKSFDVFFTYMKTAATIDPVYRFTSQEYDFGRLITSINDVAQTSSEYWAFLLRDASGAECMLQKGVTCTTPTEGQHYVFRFVEKSTPIMPCA